MDGLIAQGKEEVTSLPSTFNTINEEMQAKTQNSGSCIYTNTLNEITVSINKNCSETWLEYGSCAKYCQQAQESTTLNIL